MRLIRTSHEFGNVPELDRPDVACSGRQRSTVGREGHVTEPVVLAVQSEAFLPGRDTPEPAVPSLPTVASIRPSGENETEFTAAHVLRSDGRADRRLDSQTRTTRSRTLAEASRATIREKASDPTGAHGPPAGPWVDRSRDPR